MDIAEYKKLTKKRSKYGAKRTFYNGRWYMSKKEADYSKHLDHLKHAHEVKDRVIEIQYQVAFVIKVKNTHIAKYVSDFIVFYGDGRKEIIDVKGMRTDIYKLKRKLVEAQYNITIIER